MNNVIHILNEFNDIDTNWSLTTENGYKVIKALDNKYFLAALTEQTLYDALVYFRAEQLIKIRHDQVSN